jgi:hypothetical protein
LLQCNIAYSALELAQIFQLVMSDVGKAHSNAEINHFAIDLNLASSRGAYANTFGSLKSAGYALR